MKQINRRSFIKSSLATAAAVSMPASSWTRVLGANETIRVAVIGFHGQGGSHIKSIQGLKKDGQAVTISALCDVDSAVLDAGVAQFKKGGDDVKGYRDIRKLLENKDVDAVSIAVPNHWHALAAIWSIQAGKDVYVEKPVSHNLSEGRRIVEAARKYSKIVQTGTQCRSSTGIKEAVEWVRAGNLGRILAARGLCYKRRASIGKSDGPTEVPATIDYDLWCGPAPKGPLMRKKLHYDWHWVWATGNGDLGNQGIHQMDIARWFLGETTIAPGVLSIGGRVGYVDDGETPNTQIVFQDYRKAPLIFEVRGLPERLGSEKMDKFKGASVGVVVHCEHGYVVVPDYNSATAYDLMGRELHHFSGSVSHHGNFFAAMRSRNPKDLNADILEGHLSSALCHTGNLSYRMGVKELPEAIREKFSGDSEAQNTFNRMAEHLSVNGVDITTEKLSMGAFLRFDPYRETVMNNRVASTMITREYRAPFIVPERV